MAKEYDKRRFSYYSTHSKQRRAAFFYLLFLSEWILFFSPRKVRKIDTLIAPEMRRILLSLNISRHRYLRQLAAFEDESHHVAARIVDAGGLLLLIVEMVEALRLTVQRDIGYA